MKKIILASALSIGSLVAMQNQKPHWLMMKINACKKDDKKACEFMRKYYSNHFSNLCGGQGERYIQYQGVHRTFYTPDQQEVCTILANALADEAFANKIVQ